MLKEVLVPDIGDYANVDVIEVLVSVGDTLKKDASILTLETDKATVEVPAPFAGIVKELHVKVGDKVSQHSLIITLEVAEETAIEPVVSTEKAENKQTVIVKEIVVPDIGDYRNVDVIEVLVAVGDHFQKDASLITLETDKATVEVPAPFSGVVKSIQVKVGDKVSEGHLIVMAETIEENAPKAAAPASNAGQQALAAEPISKPLPETPRAPTNLGYVHAGPGVRRFARELGVDLSKIRGTGLKGRIVKIDIQAYVKAIMADRQGGGNNSGMTVAPWPQVDFAKFGEVTKTSLSRIKKLSGAYLHRNWVMVPHVTQFDEADITQLEKFRKEQQPVAEKQGVKLTPLLFIMKAVAEALLAFPTFNASLDASGTELILKKYVHIGIAVDTPNGLMVPVVRDVDKKDIFQLAKELGEISLKARNGQLAAQDMQGSSFSISSLGGIGGTAFTPIINVPDVAILGVSKSQIKPVYTESEFKPRLLLPLSLSYDHRVIDGAEAARFITLLSKKLSDITSITTASAEGV